MEINVTPRFIKSDKRSHKEIQEKAKAKEAVFRKNPFDKHLKTHKLSGKEKESWAFWVDYSYRLGFVPQLNLQSWFNRPRLNRNIWYFSNWCLFKTYSMVQNSWFNLQD